PSTGTRRLRFVSIAKAHSDRFCCNPQLGMVRQDECSNRAVEALPFKGRVWVGMVWLSDQHHPSPDLPLERGGEK
ncbi:MAG TPA: hypothetical protein VFG67_04115, partial [Oleiagrimonas sp.]|nr:hypothetical protein [Oleiagrimonas sp.]